MANKIDNGYDAAGHKGKIYRIEGNNGYIKGYEYNAQVEYIYHEVYSDGIYMTQDTQMFPY